MPGPCSAPAAEFVHVPSLCCNFCLLPPVGEHEYCHASPIQSALTLSLLRFQISGKMKIPNLSFHVMAPTGKAMELCAGPVSHESLAACDAAFQIAMQHAVDMSEYYKTRGFCV